MSKATLPIALLLFSVLFLTVLPSPARAELTVIEETSFFDRVINNVRDFFHLNEKEEPSDFSVSSNIEFASTGDHERNGRVDGGDTVRFRYVVSNPTDKDLSFITLDTHISRKALTYIHNIKGTVNLDDDGNNIIIPYLNIRAGQKLTVSFDAKVKNFKKNNWLIVTQPEIFDKQRKSLVKSEKKEITSFKRENNRKTEMKIKINKK